MKSLWLKCRGKDFYKLFFLVLKQMTLLSWRWQIQVSNGNNWLQADVQWFFDLGRRARIIWESDESQKSSPQKNTQEKHTSIHHFMSSSGNSWSTSIKRCKIIKYSCWYKWTWRSFLLIKHLVFLRPSRSLFQIPRAVGCSRKLHSSTCWFSTSQGFTEIKFI